MSSNENSSDSDIFVEKVVTKPNIKIVKKEPVEANDGEQQSNNETIKINSKNIINEENKSHSDAFVEKAVTKLNIKTEPVEGENGQQQSSNEKIEMKSKNAINDEKKSHAMSTSSSPSKSSNSSSKSTPSKTDNKKSKIFISSSKANTSNHTHGNSLIINEISSIEKELKNIDSEIASLKRRKATLQERRNNLQDELLTRESEKLSRRDWSTTDFEWSDRLFQLLNNIFQIENFRPLQLSAINATLSKQDLILVMPTGGGKSLCFQLPALVSSGVTLVISPLISLMEDQAMQLQNLGIVAEVMTANTKREDIMRIKKSITDAPDKKKTKLLYVSPEKVAKNKSFMMYLQKLHAANKLARIAIDEVHCCSDWGHDFRPDYIFLGVLRDMFSDVPIIGLTATASNKVINDVQKILNIQGCLVLKAPFNRPNLYYDVRPKSSERSEWLYEVELLLKNEFKNQSGIIYAFSIRDTEDIGTELRTRGIKARWYHAAMPPELRSKAHSQWLEGSLQVIVATSAFGLGINKSNVRFVIHHCLSKSIETYYQESGRAGRDGKPAKCILYYRFADYFRLSSLVFSQQTGLPKLSHMLQYCVEPTRCRRALIAEHFSDTWNSADCNNMCDHCKKPRISEERDITNYCFNAYKIINNALKNEVKLTANKLFDLWCAKGKVNLRLKDVPVPQCSRTHLENVVAHLIKSNFIKEDFHFTSYGTNSYVKVDPQGKALLDAGYRIKMLVAIDPKKRPASPTSVEESTSKRSKSTLS